MNSRRIDVAATPLSCTPHRATGGIEGWVGERVEGGREGEVEAWRERGREGQSEGGRQHVISATSSVPRAGATSSVPRQGPRQGNRAKQSRRDLPRGEGVEDLQQESESDKVVTAHDLPDKAVTTQDHASTSQDSHVPTCRRWVAFS